VNRPEPLTARHLIQLDAKTNCTMAQKTTDQEQVAPIAEAIPQELSIHGDSRIDHYYWLRDKESPKVIDYLKAENAYTEVMTAHTQALREKLYNEILGRIKQTDLSVPYKEENYIYYSRTEAGKDYPIYCRKKESIEATEEIILNVNALAEGHEYFSVGGLQVSLDQQLLGYGVDTTGARVYNLRFKDLATGETLPDEIPNTAGFAWANDNKTIFYTVIDAAQRPYQIWRHQLGSDIQNDVLVFHETDTTFRTYVYKTKSKKYLIIGSSSTLSSEMRFLEASTPAGEFQVINPREPDHEYFVFHYEDKFYIRTNLDAENFRLVETPVNQPSKEHWREVIPHREEVLLEGIEIFKDYLALEERQAGLTQIRVINWQTQDEHYLDFGEPTYTAYIYYNPEFDTNTLRYGYNSLTTPNSVYDYNMQSREKELVKQQEVLGDFDPENYLAERIHATAKDGTLVPISLVYRKGFLKNGSHPCMLTGYGSYGFSLDPYFSAARLSLLDRGFVYALAHIRGGSEMGRRWYDSGKLFHKKNTFTDFIACAEHLIQEKYTSPDKLIASGGSAGGLLIGAVVNERPDLFKGVIMDVPFVDVVTTMLDSSIPLTEQEYDEWGNPQQKEYYDYMKSYSPYDNVRPQDYPAILVTTGLNDANVQYWEPAKWVAKLRQTKTDKNLLLLKTNLGSGHGGPSGRYEQYRETAFDYAFVLDLVGITS